MEEYGFLRLSNPGNFMRNASSFELNPRNVVQNNPLYSIRKHQEKLKNTEELANKALSKIHESLGTVSIENENESKQLASEIFSHKLPLKSDHGENAGRERLKASKSNKQFNNNAEGKQSSLAKNRKPKQKLLSTTAHNSSLSAQANDRKQNTFGSVGLGHPVINGRNAEPTMMEVDMKSLMENKANLPLAVFQTGSNSHIRPRSPAHNYKKIVPFNFKTLSSSDDWRDLYVHEGESYLPENVSYYCPHTFASKSLISRIGRETPPKMDRLRFSTTVDMNGFKENEITFRTNGRQIVVTGMRPKKKGLNAKKINELIDLPRGASPDMLRIGWADTGVLLVEEKF